MRASAVVAVVCLVAPSCAAPINTRTVHFPAPNVKTLALSTAIQWAINVGTGLLTAGVWKGTGLPTGQPSTGNTTTREILEFFDKRINEELAARVYTQELLRRVPESDALNDLN